MTLHGPAPGVAAHYTRHWGPPAASHTLGAGPMPALQPGFRVLEFAPSPARTMWTYATEGMSAGCEAGASHGLEAHLFSPVQAREHVELLTMLAYFHLTAAPLGLGHTVNFGRPWLSGSSCRFGLLSLPYLDGPALEWMEGPRRTRFLWLIPLTEQEREYKARHGLEALEERLEAGGGFNYLDPRRPSVV